MESNLDRNFILQLVTNPALSYRITRHALLWSTAFILIHSGFLYIANTIPDQSAKQTYAYLSTLFFGSLTILAYIVITWVTQNFILLRFRFGLFLSSLFLIHVLISALVRYHFLFFVDLLTLDKLPRMYQLQLGHVTRLPFWQVPFDKIIVGLFSFSLLYNYLLYAVSFKVFKDLFNMKIKQEKLEKENLQLEFNFLKAQISPHFLFNTLNNIYSYSIKSPDKVPSTILKLADMMRYSLYETEAEHVPLTKELLFLDSYIQLQRIRHDEKTDLSYTVHGQPGMLLIPPFLLIVFVENAFKHGVQASTQVGWVHITLAIKDQLLSFKVENSLPANRTVQIGGIGLKNVHKRLDLFYANRYQLTVHAEHSKFIVDLTINLHEPDLSSRNR